MAICQPFLIFARKWTFPWPNEWGFFFGDSLHVSEQLDQIPALQFSSGLNRLSTGLMDGLSEAAAIVFF